MNLINSTPTKFEVKTNQIQAFKNCTNFPPFFLNISHSLLYVPHAIAFTQFCIDFCIRAGADYETIGINYVDQSTSGKSTQNS